VMSLCLERRGEQLRRYRLGGFRQVNIPSCPRRLMTGKNFLALR